MKRIILSFLTVTTLILLSCNKEESISNTNGKSIKTALIGKWFLINQVKNGIKTELNICHKTSYIEFTKTHLINVVKTQMDGAQGSEECIQETSNEEYKIEKNKIIQFEGNDKLVRTFKITGDKITINYQYSENYKFKETLKK